ncbi:MAG: hypothetical protein OEL20_01250 [Sulfuritalea sp.]|nr:hypothetical protein [Sulfuritalea sp.]
MTQRTAQYTDCGAGGQILDIGLERTGGYSFILSLSKDERARRETSVQSPPIIAFFLRLQPFTLEKAVGPQISQICADGSTRLVRLAHHPSGWPVIAYSPVNYLALICENLRHLRKMGLFAVQSRGLPHG